jgi:cytochrome P450
MEVFHQALGNVFQIALPAFTPVVLVGPEAARFVLVEAREGLRWRMEGDPVVDLLRHGVLVEDGESHDELRALMTPSLHRRMLDAYFHRMLATSERVTAIWQAGQVRDMLDEMRSIALLILTDTLFRVDFMPDLQRLWDPVLASIRYISPGVWMLWRGAPRPGYRRQLARLDAYLYRIIHERRAGMEPGGPEPGDLLGLLIAAGLNDDLIRDQLLTMLIAGHDTSTAALAWSLYLLGSHPTAMARAAAEARAALEGGSLTPDRLRELPYIARVVRESLRLYPPIHLGSRVAARELAYQGYRIPAGERVIYSIYLTQRDDAYWANPGRFDPDRHGPGERAAPYSWLAFGGGPRNCIGAAFGLMEVKLVLAHILGHFELELVEPHVRPHMGATLEPHPGVRMRVSSLYRGARG